MSEPIVVESRPKVFYIEQVQVVENRPTWPEHTRLVCYPEEAKAYSALVGKKVRIRSVIEVIEEEPEEVQAQSEPPKGAA